MGTMTMGSICQLRKPVLCLLAYGDYLLSNPSFFQQFGTHKEGYDNDTFRAAFPSIWLSWDPQTLENKGPYAK